MANLKSQLENDLKAALLGGDRFKGEVLRNFKAVILNEEVATGTREAGLDDESIEKLLAREVKKRAESASLYDQAGRPELSETERQEAKVLEAYLPAQVGEDEIKTIIAKKAAELGLSGPAAMGQLIGAVKKELGNTADGSIIAKLVREALQ